MLTLLLLIGLESALAQSQPAARNPKPQLSAPAGSSPAVRDTCANFWTLAPAENNQRKLLVLPAQEPTAWIDPRISGAEPSDWRTIRADELGFVWLTQGARTMRFDPRKPQEGARAMIFAPTTVAAQQQWQIVTRMPASNHDLTAAVWRDKLYVAGGLTAEWGFPTRSHPFDELWELDTGNWTWRVAGRFGRGRIYCATAAFDSKIWIVGGDVIEADGTRHAVTTVQLYDARTGKVTEGVPNTIARPMPLALAAQGRLYVLGNERDKYDQPGEMESLGVGETVWRREPAGPAGMGPLAGTVLDGKLYVAVRERGLAIYDPATKHWEADAASPFGKPRSCQMTAYRGEIWLLGGRDTAGEDQTLIYAPQTKTWRPGPRLPRPLSWGAAEVVNDQLIVTGGAASYGKDYLYNDLTFVWRGKEQSAAKEKR
ncbi:MAG: hypothetical protein HYR56_25485 [Acidobacteria bacterium]|nr:hypothetical protein [Acidobacteriota bacterium]MBI3425401.1 hypothetical protein [Acidobacteriota bacterium]